MSELIYDLVIEGRGLSSAGLYSSVLSLGTAYHDTMPGVVRVEHVSPAAAGHYIGALRHSGLDASLVPAGLRLSGMKLLASDLDGTISPQETLDQTARESGLGEKIAKATAAAMRGECRCYAESLRTRIRLMKGVPAKRFEEAAEKAPLSEGAEKFFSVCRAAGIRTVIVTSGFEEVCRVFQRRTGADAFHCNRLITENGLLSGETAGPEELGGRIIDADGKLELLRLEAAALQASANEIIAVGDGWNDVKMLEFAGVGAAYHAKPRVKAEIPVQISTLGLDSILPLFTDAPEWIRKAGYHL